MVGAIQAEAPEGWRTGPDLVSVVRHAFDESGLLGHRNLGDDVVPLMIEQFNDDRDKDAAVGAFDGLARWLKDTEWEPPDGV
jgi:hypothetical protein